MDDNQNTLPLYDEDGNLLLDDYTCDDDMGSLEEDEQAPEETEGDAQ